MNKFQFENFNIASISGNIVDVAQLLIGKTICFPSQVNQFGFEYVVQVESVTYSKNKVTLNGLFIFKNQRFHSTHEYGKNLYTLLWLLEPKGGVVL